jgi:putative ABC transport system permease protein
VLLLLLGGCIGVAVSGIVVDVVRAKLGDQLPLARLDSTIWLSGLALMILIGLVVGALPAVRGMRLRIVDALSGR